MRNKMTDNHKDQLLDALMYRVTPDVRAAVMAEVPAAYNAYIGREVCAVVRNEDLLEVLEESGRGIRVFP